MGFNLFYAIIAHGQFRPNGVTTMSNQPTLERRAPADTFFYVQVVAEDESDAQNQIAIALQGSFQTFSVALTSPAENNEELETFVFVVYGAQAPATHWGDRLSDLYTQPHLVDAPCFDIDDFT